MKINFTPQRSEETLTLIKQGDTLSFNGVVEDFSGLQDGYTLPQEGIDNKWIFGGVKRASGEIEITIRYPYQEQNIINSFPAPILDAEDGEIKPVATTYVAE